MVTPSHFYPVDDTKEHNLNGTFCECSPHITYDEGGALVVTHNSYDQREFGNEPPSVTIEVIGDE